MYRKIIYTALLLLIIAGVAFIFIRKERTIKEESPISRALDSIEALMLQEPEKLDRLLAQIDTTYATAFETARYELITGFIYNKKAEFTNSIGAIEKAETYFYKANNQYYIHYAKLIKAFTFEFLMLHDDAAQFYSECETYFEKHNHIDYRFYALLGLLRLSDQLHIDRELIIWKITQSANLTNQPYYSGLMHASMAMIEKNDSIKINHYNSAKEDFTKAQDWKNVFAVKLNSFMVLLKFNDYEKAQKAYNELLEKTHQYTPTNYQELRLSYGHAYILMKRGLSKEAIDVATNTFHKADSLNISKEKGRCLELLSFLHRRNHDYKNAYSSLQAYYSTYNKEVRVMQHARLQALGAHYRYSTMEKEKLALKLKVQYYLLFVSFFIIVFILVVLWYNHHLRKSKYREKSLIKKNEQIEFQINDLLQSLEQQEEQNVELINQVQATKQQYQDTKEIKEFLNAIDQQKIMTWIEFEACFNQLRPNWVNNLKEKMPKLTPTDIKYCMCFYFNLNNFATARLCEVGPDAVKGAKKRIRKKLGLDDAKEIYSYLKVIEHELH